MHPHQESQAAWEDSPLAEAVTTEGQKEEVEVWVVARAGATAATWEVVMVEEMAGEGRGVAMVAEVTAEAMAGVMVEVTEGAGREEDEGEREAMAVQE